MKDISGNSIRDMDHFVEEDNESFEFQFIAPEELEGYERKNFNM